MGNLKKAFGIVIVAIIVVLVIVLVSGKRTIIKSELTSFENAVWARPDVATLTLDIQPCMLNRPFDLYLDLEHSIQIRKNMMRIDLEIITPSNEERIAEYKIWFKNNEGKFKGTPQENLYHLHQILRTNFEFNQVGVWKFIIQQRSEFQYLEGVRSVQLVAVPSEPVKEE